MNAPPISHASSAAGPRPAWSIDGLVASAPAAHPRVGGAARMPIATIRLDRAAAGIAVDHGSDASRTPHVLGLVLDPAMKPDAGEASVGFPPSDRWVRGEDVVAVYEPADPRSLRATAMWRRWACETPGVAAWELVVSCQTSLLESDATVVVRSVLPDVASVEDAEATAGEWPSAHRGQGSKREAVARAMLARSDAGPTILVAMHPLDSGRLTLRPAGGGVAIESHLFASRLEKGVLLRGRSLAAIGPREGDAVWAARLLDAFRDSPPPLTT